MDYGKLYYNISTVCFSHAQTEFHKFKVEYLANHRLSEKKRSLLYLGYGSNMQFYLNAFHDLNLRRVVVIVSNEDQRKKSLNLKGDWNKVPGRKKIYYEIKFVIKDFEKELTEQDVAAFGKFDIFVSLWGVYWGHEDARIMRDNVFRLLVPDGGGFVLFHSCNELFEIYYDLASQVYLNYLEVVLEAMQSYRGLKGRGKAATLFSNHGPTVSVNSKIEDSAFNQMHIIERMLNRCGGSTVRNLLREDLIKLQQEARKRHKQEVQENKKSASPEEFDYLFNVTTEIIGIHLLPN